MKLDTEIANYLHKDSVRIVVYRKMFKEKKTYTCIKIRRAIIYNCRKKPQLPPEKNQQPE